MAVVTNVAASGPEAVVTISVTRTLTGTLSVGSTVAAIWSPPALPGVASPGSDIGASGIWFLQQKDGGWAVLPIAAGTVPLSQIYFPAPSGAVPAAYAYAATAKPEVKLAWEVAAAAADPASGSAAARIVGSGALDGAGSTVLSPVWAQLAASTDPLAQAVGLGGQIRLGSSAALATIAGLNPAKFPSNAQDRMSASICGYTNANPGSVSSLGLLTRSGYNSNLQFCAIHALREIHTREALPYLSQFLDSTSVRLQYEAVAGIASFANGLPVQTAQNTADLTLMTVPANASFATADTRTNFPNRRTFATQPQMYISFWKNWLAAHTAN